MPFCWFCHEAAQYFPVYEFIHKDLYSKPVSCENRFMDLSRTEKCVSC